MEDCSETRKAGWRSPAEPDIPSGACDRHGRGSLALKIAGITVLPLFAALLSMAAFLYLLASTKGEASYVDIAGRQRMMATRLPLLAHWIMDGEDEPRKELARRIRQFDRNLEILQSGGWVNDLYLPRPPERITRHLDPIREIWGELAPLYHRIASAPEDSHELPAWVERAEVLSRTHFEHAHTYVGIARSWVEKKRNVLILVPAVGTLLCAAMLGIAWWMVRRSILRPITLMLETCGRMARGDLSARAPILANDELGELALTFNEVTRQLEGDRNRISHFVKNWRYSMNGVDSAICVHGSDGRIIDVNAAMVRLLASESDEALRGRNIEEVIGTRFGDRSCCAGEQSADGILSRDRVDNVTGRTYRIDIHPIRTPSGEWFGALHTYLDVMDQVERERRHEDLRRQLIAVSQQAGMAAVAEHVLHNVGNALNSVNVSARLLADAIDRFDAETVAKLSNLLPDADELSRFVQEDPRAKHLPELLRVLATHLLEQRDSSRETARSLQRSIVHIRQIVEAQNANTHGDSKHEPVLLDEVVRDALEIKGADLERSEIQIEAVIEPLPPCIGVHNALLEVVINLLQNARAAIADHDSDERWIWIHVHRSAPDRAAIEVADSGIGIRPEIFPRLFERGFTTRPEGHGIGLHWSRSTVRSYGGDLVAASDGPGCGATFTVDLPLAADHTKEDSP
jgi:signal transduction histidine kinase